MTQKKVENIVKKHILKSLSGNYKITNGYLIKMPINDILVGYCFERSSFENMNYIWWFAMPLYIPHDLINLTFGNRIATKAGDQLWDFSDLTIENTLINLIPELLKHERTINEFENPLNFYNFYTGKKNKNLRIFEAITYSACWMGSPNMYQDIETCLKFIKENCDMSIGWIKEISNDLKLLQGLKTKGEIFETLKNLREKNLAKLKLN